MSDEPVLSVFDETHRNSRGYGWEVGRGAPLAKEVPLSPDNPFNDPNWWKDIGPPGDEESSNLVAHFRRELELINEEPEIIEMYVKVAQAFTSFGHSGGSAMLAIPVINELLQFNNLSPLTDDPNEWLEYDEDVAGSEWKWQNKRNSTAFSRDGGKTYYLLHESNDQHVKVMHPSKKVMFSPDPE